MICLFVSMRELCIMVPFFIVQVRQMLTQNITSSHSEFSDKYCSRIGLLPSRKNKLIQTLHDIFRNETRWPSKFFECFKSILAQTSAFSLNQINSSSVYLNNCMKNQESNKNLGLQNGYGIFFLTKTFGLYFCAQRFELFFVL